MIVRRVSGVARGAGLIVGALALVLCASLTLSACATVVPIRTIDDVAGQWDGHVSSPAGNARATMTIVASGDYSGTIGLDQGERRFRGALVVVRPGEVRYQGTEGNGWARLSRDDGRVVLKFLRDDGGVDAVFRRER